MKSTFLLHISLLLSGIVYGQNNGAPSRERILIKRGERMKELLVLDENQYVHVIQLLHANQTSTDSIGRLNLNGDQRKVALTLVDHIFYAALRTLLKEGQWNTFLEDDKRKRVLLRQRMQEKNAPYKELAAGY